MKRGSIKYNSAIWCLAPLLIGFLLAAFVFLADPSAMSLWRVRSLAATGVTACLLGHCIAMIVLFAKRRWKSGLSALVILPLFFIIAFLVALMTGPNIEAVTEKVSAATAVPQSEIKCLGGWLRREAILVFEIPKDTTLQFEKADATPGNEILPYLKECADRLNLQMPAQGKVLRYRLEFDTVYVVYDRDRRLVFFFGMIVM